MHLICPPSPPPQVLHNICLSFLLGITASREKLKAMFVQNYGAGANEVHYGRCASGVLSPFDIISSWKIGNKITLEF